MALVHVQIIQLARHLNRVVHLPERELVVSAFTQSTTRQAHVRDASRRARLRHRTGGRNLMVGHVSVTDQSIVANVTTLPSEAARDNAATSAPLLVEAEPKPVTTTAHVERASPRYKGERVKRRRKLQNSRTVQDKMTHTRNFGPMLSSPRCGARTRSGKPCQSPAVANKKRCRMPRRSTRVRCSTGQQKRA